MERNKWFDRGMTCNNFSNNFRAGYFVIPKLFIREAISEITSNREP